MSEEQRALTGAPSEAAVASTGGVGSAADVSRRAEPSAAGVISHLRYVFRSLRPRQWTKNLIVYIALIFSIEQEWQVSDPDSWASLLGRSTLVFLFFCLVSSADYLINDIADR